MVHQMMIEFCRFLFWLIYLWFWAKKKLPVEEHLEYTPDDDEMVDVVDIFTELLVVFIAKKLT